MAPVRPWPGGRSFDSVQLLARGWGVETALTVDVLRKGYKITEVPAGFHHRVTGRSLRQYLDRWMASRPWQTCDHDWALPVARPATPLPRP